MAKTRNVCTLTLGMMLLAGHLAFAQTPAPATEKFFVNVNFGGQMADRSLSADSTTRVYDEDATLSSSQPIGGGMVFDVGGGYRVYNDIFVGVVISRFSNSSAASYTARVPHPFFFNRIRTTTGSKDDLKRNELAVSPHVTWVTTLADKLDLSGSIGVAIFQLKQDLTAPLCTSGTGTGCSTIPANSQDVVVATGSEDGTGVGPFAQVDVIYNLTSWYGIGGYVRYAGAKVDLGSAADLNVGGMQAGGGIRLRF